MAIRWRVADEESLQRSPLDHVHRTQGHVWWASADGIRPCAPLQPTVTRPVSTHSQANLVGADLRVAYLVGAYLGESFLNGAKVNEDTTWPEGFDPVAAGVIFED